MCSDLVITIFFPVPLWQLFKQTGGRFSQPVWFLLVTKLTHDTVVSIIHSVRAHCPLVIHHLHVSSYLQPRTPPSARALVPTYPTIRMFPRAHVLHPPHVPSCQNTTLFTYHILYPAGPARREEPVANQELSGRRLQEIFPTGLCGRSRHTQQGNVCNWPNQVDGVAG